MQQASHIDSEHDFNEAVAALRMAAPDVTRALVRLIGRERPIFGTVTISFQAGTATTAEKRETFKS